MTGSEKSRVALGLAAAGLAVIGIALASRSGSSSAPAGVRAAVTLDAGPREDVIEDEGERAAYVEKFVEVSEVEVGPDLKSDADGGARPVGGLFKATGVVTNKGDRAIKTARLSLEVMDADGKVIGAYFEDVVGRKRLTPGEARPFKFTIPEKKEYGGKFSFQLR